VTFTYDANHNLVAMQDGTGQSTWKLDALNRVTGSVDGLGRELSLTYDADGNRTALTYPSGGQVTYQYDANDRLAAMIDPQGRAATYSRDAAGQVTGILYPNGVHTTILYDPAGRVISRANVTDQGKTGSAFSYAYDTAGRVVQVTAQYAWRNPGTVTETRSYDGMGRLDSFRSSDGLVMSYDYDAAGNRTTWRTNDDPATAKPGDGFSAAYTYNATDLLINAEMQDEQTGYTYDANGNRTAQVINSGRGPTRGTRYAYDPENRLAALEMYQQTGHGRQSGRGSEAITYDGLGRRLAQETDGSRSEYAYDGNAVLGEYGAGGWNEFYRDLQDEPVAMQNYPGGQDGQAFWYQLDGFGNVAGVAKQQGQSIHNYRYDPFGNLQQENSSFTEPHNDLTWAGMPLDPLTGLYFFNPAVYDPWTGTWLSPEP
jgi:RHS repeat-associated protein